MTKRNCGGNTVPATVNQVQQFAPTPTNLSMHWCSGDAWTLNHVPSRAIRRIRTGAAKQGRMP
jgi:hypothetical protein